jgi:hypothetical protein
MKLNFLNTTMIGFFCFFCSFSIRAEILGPGRRDKTVQANWRITGAEARQLFQIIDTSKQVFISGPTPKGLGFFSIDVTPEISWELHVDNGLSRFTLYCEAERQECRLVMVYASSPDVHSYAFSRYSPIVPGSPVPKVEASLHNATSEFREHFYNLLNIQPTATTGVYRKQIKLINDFIQISCTAKPLDLRSERGCTFTALLPMSVQ